VNTVFAERLTARAAVHGLRVLSVHLPKLQVYSDLLLRWNQRINLTALPLSGWPDETLDRLFLEPIAASSAVAGLEGNWVDLGSGGGSPALPLAILNPQLKLTLTESRGKKAAFLREAIRSIPVPDATVAGRFEDLLARPAASCRLMTCRAVKPEDTVEVASHLLASCAIYLYFGTLALGSLGGLTPVGTRALPGGDVLTILTR
jgi:16S rRNA (guanine527-N7)-methyltransferase